MHKLTYEGMDLDVYNETLDNGLDIYVVPMPKFTKMYATFTTKFGSIHNAFRFQGQEEYTSVPDGIAHFLEHKMFENENGVDPFTFYGKSGTSANANTWYYRTTYLFKGRENFSENLNYLLDFVQQPYLTEENVAKEKGIIVEEAQMYLDHPYFRLIETATYNTFTNNPIRIPVIGTIDSINGITKEELTSCYNTFYHPSNMILVISGPVDPEEVLEIAKGNQSKKNYAIMPKIEVKPFDEPDHVSKEFEEVKLDVKYPKATINFKINYEEFGMDLRTIDGYLNLYLNIKFSDTSMFTNQLIDDKLILGYLSYDTTVSKKHIIISMACDSEYPENVIGMIKEEIKKTVIEEVDFNRKKKVMVAHLISANENITVPNGRVFENLVIFGNLGLNIGSLVKNMQYSELMNMLGKLNFNNNTVVIIKPINE